MCSVLRYTLCIQALPHLECTAIENEIYVYVLQIACVFKNMLRREEALRMYPFR